jgi:uncharacterized protein (TIGR02271 family)
MPAPRIEAVQDWEGRTMVDPAGGKIGTIANIYLDDDTGQPEWVTVKGGRLGSKQNFVPLAEAQAAGDNVQVPYDKEQIKNAPGMRAHGRLSQEEEGELYRYYGLDYGESRSESGLPEGRAEENRAATGQASGDAPATAVGRDMSGPTTDDAMTRSEEELRVGKTRRERGRVRLRKYVTTEERQVTVPVEREEVRVERETITDANVDAATSGPQISEEEHEVVLHEEEPVVEKRVVPKERVRLGKETVADEEQVGGEVRQEQIEVEGQDQVRRHDQR